MDTFLCYEAARHALNAAHRLQDVLMPIAAGARRPLDAEADVLIETAVREIVRAAAAQAVAEIRRANRDR